MKNIIFLLIGISLFSSCSDDEYESVFSKTSDERVLKSCEQLKDILTSSDNGWKSTYFMNNGIALSFYQLFDFKDDLQVAITTYDYDEPKFSEYVILGGPSIELKFSTWNDNFTWIAEPNGSFTKGFGAEMEFLLVSCSDSKIVFEGKAYKGKFVLEKANMEDKNLDMIFNYSQLFKQQQKYKNNSILIESGIAGATKENPIVALMKFEKPGDTFIFNLEYKSVDGSITSSRSTTLFTPKGMTISESIKIGGKEINNFIYDSKSNHFVINEEGITGKIVNTAFPGIAISGVADELIKVKHAYRLSATSEYDKIQFAKEYDNIIKELLQNRNYYEFDFSKIKYVVDYVQQVPALDEEGNVIKDGYKTVTKDGIKLGTGFLFCGDYSTDLEYVFLPTEVIKISEDRAKFKFGELTTDTDEGLSYLKSLDAYSKFIELFSDEKGFFLENIGSDNYPKMRFTKLSDPEFLFEISE